MYVHSRREKKVSLSAISYFVSRKIEIVIIQQGISMAQEGLDWVLTEDDGSVKIGTPLHLSPELQEKICQPWKNALIIKLVGIAIGFKNLQLKLTNLWRPSSAFQMIDLGYDFYVVKMTSQEDLDKILLNGPWFIGDNFLSVQRWKPNFHPAISTITARAVWVRLADLPMKYYDPAALLEIAKRIGKPLKIDSITLAKSRGRFARFCVEISVDTPLVTSVALGQFHIKVQYENLQQICYLCGRIGHEKQHCSLRLERMVVEDTQQLGKEHEGLFGPWMMVDKRRQKLWTHPKARPINKSRFTNKVETGNGGSSTPTTVGIKSILIGPLARENAVTSPRSTSHNPFLVLAHNEQPQDNQQVKQMELSTDTACLLDPHKNHHTQPPP